MSFSESQPGIIKAEVDLREPLVEKRHGYPFSIRGWQNLSRPVSQTPPYGQGQ